MHDEAWNIVVDDLALGKGSLTGLVYDEDFKNDYR